MKPHYDFQTDPTDLETIWDGEPEVLTNIDLITELPGKEQSVEDKYIYYETLIHKILYKEGIGKLIELQTLINELPFGFVDLKSRINKRINKHFVYETNKQ